MRTPSWRSSGRRAFSDDGGGEMLEVMLELDKESTLVKGVEKSFSRSSSTESRIRRKFPWLWSPARSTSDPPAMAAREERRKQARLERTKSGAQQALNGLRFIRNHSEALWEAVETRFHALAVDNLLRRQNFGECIGMVDSEDFAMGIFDALARRRRQNLDRIALDELREFWLEITDQSFDARLQIFFDMVDTNVDGRITREEVRELIVLSASANKLAKLQEQAEEYAALIMEELDPENLGYIEIWQLEALLLQRDCYMNYSRPMSAASMVRSRNPLRQLLRRLRLSAQEHWRRAWVLFLWFAAMGFLFAWKFSQYRHRPEFNVMGYCLPTAKGAAETLKLNMALVLLPVCRNTLTWLRSTRARLFLPFDDNLNFHKIIAAAIMAGILLHAGNHLACDFPRVINSSSEDYIELVRDFGRKRPSYGSFVGGVEGVTGISMLALMAVSFTLATSWFRKNLVRLPPPLNRLTGFNAFWYSHHLLALVYLLLIVHGLCMQLVHRWYQKTTWMYVAAPLLLYLGERSLRTLRSEAFTVRILKVAVLPGSVLILVMSKPLGFKYKSGQYIFLNCPAISPFEWHPFSITSAPDDGHLSVHIRTLGDWTQELRRAFAEANRDAVIGRGSFADACHLPQNTVPRLLVDGPYGAPAQNYKSYDVLLLVGLGIGATPFISVLRDLLNSIRAAEEPLEEECCKEGSSVKCGWGKKRGEKTRCAHFYWVTREPGSLEWFKGVMNEVAEMDHKGVIEMHNYLTSVYEEGDARSTLLAMVQALNHAKHGVDIVSGTRVRTHFARPNWGDVFARIASRHPSATVGVFYCGVPALAKELKSLSQELTHRTTTRFHFHKEYF